MRSASLPRTRLFLHGLSLRGGFGADVGDHRSASVEKIGRALMPLLYDRSAMAELRAILYDRGNAPTSVSRQTDHDVLRQVAVLLHRERPSEGSPRASVSTVHFAEPGERRFDHGEAVRFADLDAAAAFLAKALEAHPAGVDAVIKKIGAQAATSPAGPGRPRVAADPRAATSPAGLGQPRVAADPDAIRRLAVLLHKGELAVAPSRDDDSAFYFFRPSAPTAIAPAPAPAAAAPKPRPAAAAPPPEVVEFAPLPAPSGAAPPTCLACMRAAAAEGTPFVAT